MKKQQGREFDKSKYQHWIDPAEVKPYERNVGNEKRLDWAVIRAEYVAGGISQRKLAAKW